MSCELLHLLGLARRAGRVAMGESMSEEAVRGHRVRLLLAAGDASDGTLRRTRRMAGERIPLAVLPCTRAELGAALGKESCAVCAVTDLGFAVRLAALVEDPAFAPQAAELAQKQAKIACRKQKKPQKAKK